ncbi:hypothetical protein M9H77_00108 [Catharanthus roseus]|nr:hypothetical protein M9H77_00108 [Catharanthus roseus]
MLGRNHIKNSEDQEEIVGKEHPCTWTSMLGRPRRDCWKRAILFFDKVVFKEEGRKSWNFENLVATIPHLNFEVIKLEKHQDYSSILNAFDYLCKAWKSLQDT